jgi:hypothetical protein
MQAPEGGPPDARRPWLGSAILVGALLAMLAASAAVAWYVWNEMRDIEIGTHGLIALGLGVGATLLLGAGLMALVFVSSRRGYDDEAGRD